MNRKLYKLILSLIIILLLIVIANLLFSYNVLNTIYSLFLHEDEIESSLSFIAYDNQDINNVKVLVTINNANGIEYVIEPNGNIINGNGKTNVSLDYIVPLDSERIFKVKVLDEDETENKLLVTQKDIDEYFFIKSKSDNITSDNRYIKSTVSVDYKNRKSTDTLSCRLNNSNSYEYINWNNNINNVNIWPSNILSFDESTLTGKVSISMRRQDNAGNILYGSVECELDFSRFVDTPVYSAEIADNPYDNYGRWVMNYDGGFDASGIKNIWRIYHIDEENNVYLIPNSAVKKISNLGVVFNNKYEITQYLCTDGKATNGDDTSSKFYEYTDIDKLDYILEITGAPTVSLFTESWNKLKDPRDNYGTWEIPTLSVTGSEGYSISDGISLNINDTNNVNIFSFDGTTHVPTPEGKYGRGLYYKGGLALASMSIDKDIWGTSSGYIGCSLSKLNSPNDYKNHSIIPIVKLSSDFPLVLYKGSI